MVEGYTKGGPDPCCFDARAWEGEAKSSFLRQEIKKKQAKFKTRMAHGTQRWHGEADGGCDCRTGDVAAKKTLTGWDKGRSLWQVEEAGRVTEDSLVGGPRSGKKKKACVPCGVSSRSHVPKGHESIRLATRVGRQDGLAPAAWGEQFGR